MQNQKYITRIYIDGANLYKGLPDIDYIKFMKFLRDKYKPQDVFIFIGYLEKQNDLYKFLTDAGYKLIFRETITNKEGNIKGNCDGELIVKSLEDFYDIRYNRGVLISGDGDFDCLIKFWYRKNISCLLLAPSKKYCSYLLKKNIKLGIIYLNDEDIHKDIKK